MLGTDCSALQIESGQELERFDLGTFRLNGQEYTILTGFENNPDHLCWWCGQPIQGRRSRHYCNGHRILYLNHFDWSYASPAAIDRADHKCQNCGRPDGNWYREIHSRMGILLPAITDRRILEVHHIVPLKGGERQFTAYNLPWNLIVLCHDCHVEIHRIMNEVNKIPKKTIWELAQESGQLVMNL